MSSDDPGQTQHIGADELAALRNELAEADDSPTPPASALDAAQAEALARALAESQTLRELVDDLTAEGNKTRRRADRLTAIMRGMGELVTSVGMAISVAIPPARVVALTAGVDVLAPTRPDEPAPESVDDWPRVYGPLMTTSGEELPGRRWPLALALEGHTTGPGHLFLLGGRVLEIIAIPIEVGAEIWGVCLFREPGRGGDLSGASGS